jgi:hypothetical protein
MQLFIILAGEGYVFRRNTQIWNIILSSLTTNLYKVAESVASIAIRFGFRVDNIQ